MNDNNNNFVSQSVWGGDDEEVPLLTTFDFDYDLLEDQRQTQEEDQNQLLLDLSQVSSHYVDDFSPLPLPLDFTCMSSSSSSSTSSNARWPPLMSYSDLGKMQLDNHVPFPMAPPPANGIDWTSVDDAISVSPQDSNININIVDDCLNMMEGFDFTNVLDQIDFLDSSCSIFQVNHDQEVVAAPQHEFMQQQAVDQPIDHHEQVQHLVANEDSFQDHQDESCGGLNNFLQGNRELSAVFLEWLMQNKDSISPDDLRNIKLKHSTIQMASKCLGNTDEGQKHLFKLILQWVELNLLHRKCANAAAPPPLPPPDPSPPPYLNQNPNSNSGNLFATNLYPNSILPLNINSNCFTPSPWIQPPPPYGNQFAYQTPAVPYPTPATGYVYDPYSNKIVNGNHCVPLSPQMEYSSEPNWSGQKVSPQQVNSFWGNNTSTVAMAMGMAAVPNNPLQLQGVNGINSSNSYRMFDENGERLVKLGPIATKEARKKRMARHKRLAPHHNHQVDQQPHEQLNPPAAAACAPNLVYNWPQTHPTDDHPIHPPDDHQPQENMKKENNLQFLLQKVLKQSDVGSLGRIVLPKKEAEMHLPELKSSNGIQITVQDIATSKVWTMRYRFWPNNNSRMYLFENTGEFVRTNGLEEGDFIVLYSDTKSGKYLIRGVKVRQSETRPAAVVNKKATKKSRNAPKST